jgi:hypothetical protein
MASERITNSLEDIQLFSPNEIQNVWPPRVSMIVFGLCNILTGFGTPLQQLFFEDFNGAYALKRNTR